MISNAPKQAALEHALKEFPRESCGLIVIDRGEEIYFPCKNIAKNQSDFILDPADYVAAEELGDIVGVVHSHPNVSPKPSQADLVACEASCLPWHIIAVPIGSWYSFTPTGFKAPLVGRQFSHGILDCYALIRDWFKAERGVDLLDFERPEEWWNNGGNLYIDNFKKAGFAEIPIGEIQPGDVILMQIRSKTVNHAAVYLGNNIILHHVMNRLSCREILGGFWLKNTRLVVRYQGTQ